MSPFEYHKQPSSYRSANIWMVTSRGHSQFHCNARTVLSVSFVIERREVRNLQWLSVMTTTSVFKELHSWSSSDPRRHQSRARFGTWLKLVHARSRHLSPSEGVKRSKQLDKSQGALLCEISAARKTLGRLARRGKREKKLRKQRDHWSLSLFKQHSLAQSITTGFAGVG